MTFPDKITVLYIDDESNNLHSFRASFRRKYHVLTALSAAEGMKLLNEQDVHIIIADQRMPQSTGVDFFNIVRKSHPDPIRILLTGYTDAEAIVDAINKGEIYRYIKKPWDELELQNAIDNAYDIYITRRRLHQKIDELEKKNHELNRFVYSISHDLRSPLASIMGILSLAHMENSVVDPNNYLGMIATCTDKMDLFIQKIIEYYKGIRADDENVEIDFDILLKDSIDMSRMQNPAIQFHTEVNQSAAFYTDAFRLSIIINNLISNAVKYQREAESKPRVTVTVNADAAKADIEIEDNGIGILDQHLNNVFKMFFRGHTTVNGVGIGLFIVKEALQNLGGDIQVQSTYGEGTTFRLSIPNRATALVPEQE